MSDFKDHILYVIMACAVLGCATALTVTGHLTGEAVVGLLGAAIPTGLGLGKGITTSTDVTDSTVSSSDTRPL